jgi:acylphosphatase
MSTPGESQPPEIKRFRAVVHGRVQGVNFRYYTREKAHSLGLVGYVRNCWDRTVEVVAEGEEVALQELLAWLHEGPSMAHVSRVEVNWQAPRGENDHFEVRS